MKKLTTTVFGDPQTELTMSSLDIAQYTGKRHYNIIRDIEKLNESYEELNELKIEGVEYIDSKGETRPCYNLNKGQVIDLISGYNSLLRLKINKRWRELEEQIKKPNPSELSRMQILQMAIESEQGRLKLLEVNKELESENEEMSPKAEFYDYYVDSEGLYSMEVVAKIINIKNIGLHNIFKVLRELKIIQTGNNKRVPYQAYIKSKCFEVKTYIVPENGKPSYTTKVTPKGLDYIAKRIKASEKYNKINNTFQL